MRMTFQDVEASLPWGLHDAYLEGFALDWTRAQLELTVRLMMSEQQDMDQRARVTVRGWSTARSIHPRSSVREATSPCQR